MAREPGGSQTALGVGRARDRAGAGGGSRGARAGPLSLRFCVCAQTAGRPLPSHLSWSSTCQGLGLWNEANPGPQSGHLRHAVRPLRTSVYLPAKWGWGRAPTSVLRERRHSGNVAITVTNESFTIAVLPCRPQPFPWEKNKIGSPRASAGQRQMGVPRQNRK